MKYLLMMITVLLVYFTISVACQGDTDEDATIEAEISDEDSGDVEVEEDDYDTPGYARYPGETELEKYRTRFHYHRGVQQQVMDTVFKKTEKDQLSPLITGMVSNIFRIFLEARANLTKVGFVPGDEFPEDEFTRDSWSKVLENTFMFGDILLSRPTLVHEVYDAQREWKDTLSWAYQVCMKSGVFDLNQQKFLDLVAMEGNVLPKDLNFNNPYLHESELPRKRFEDPKPPEKKPPKKIERGPKLSHGEL